MLSNILEFMMNFPRFSITPELVSRFLGLMLIAWQPFTSGARLPSILLLLLGSWLLFRKRIDLSGQSVRRLGIVFIMLLVPILVSLPGSFDLGGTLSVATALILFFFAGLALMEGLKTEADHGWLQRWLTIVLLVWLGDGYIQFVFGHDLLGIPMGSDGRMMGPFADNLHFGLFITVLMPIMLWRMAKERPLAAIAVIGLVGFVAGMSGSRSNVLFYLLAIATLIPRFGWWHRAFIVLALLVGVAAAVGQSEVASSKFQQLDTRTGQSLFQKLDHMLSGRMIIWETAGNMLKDRPLTGVGTGAFADAYDHYATRPDDPFRSGGSYVGGAYHAHQMYVSVAAESGLIGLAGLLAAIALLVRWYVQASPGQRALAAPYAASLAVIAFPLQSQPVLYRAWWFPIVLLLLCGLVIALQPKKS
jgi:O-antigen ligase